ncbi:hypothetical protein BJ122_102273 [Rhodopseudomonas faecalis]|uniref:Tail assembly chaperone E/41/14-like protein n=1 Tax=Rhodopseudomonas faecalis TaxID=99655 RepID=A0A318TMF3_9BRAD|nr:phage tail assembly protein [Rhodopseudomonas faecalis]PYF05047.1 hypothetical protein BJ122_102273 [Rhodopseudomonas faecalis]
MTEVSMMPQPDADVAAVRYVSDKPRSRSIPLEFPVEYDGKRYDQVTVSRMTTAQVADFMAAVHEQGGKAKLPMYDCPHELLPHLDADDGERVDAAVMDFLPRALREAGASLPQTGDGSSR